MPLAGQLGDVLDEGVDLRGLGEPRVLLVDERGVERELAQRA